eukprot:s10851_g1.t1
MMADSGEEGEDWGEDEMAVDSQVLRAQTQEGSISAVDAVLERSCMMHRLSRVVHVLDDSQARFLCGRISSSNYSRLDPYLPVLRIGSIMSASTLDSEAAFQARAKELGLKDDVIQKLKEGNISSFGNLAFASPYQIGQADEGPLVEALTAILGRAPTVLELVPLRRLWFEASTAAMAELKLKVERSDATEPMRLPIAERTSRLADQKARLVGVSITPELEPSHKLIDTVCQMSLDQQLSWIPWDKLTSRASEVMAASKTDLNITFDVNGALKLQRKFSDGQCSLTGDLQIRQALQRRSLAFDQAKLCSYMAMERPGRFAPYTPPKGTGKGKGKGRKGKGEQAEVMAASKTDLNITFDVNGALKLQRKFSDGQCSLTGDLQIRQALQRRSLAFDQAKLCSYMAMERYHDELFQAMCREPPPNCLCISMAQVKEADRQLFLRISELTKGALSLRPDGSMPFEGHLGTVALLIHGDGKVKAADRQLFLRISELTK